MTEFQLGDLVYHMNVMDGTDERKLTGRVTGFCPGKRWVRVKTMDGRPHVWLKEHVEQFYSEAQVMERA